MKSFFLLEFITLSTSYRYDESLGLDYLRLVLKSNKIYAIFGIV